MRVRESGMPPQDYWDSFFDVDRILDELLLDSSRRDVLEFGCGYGTFTLPKRYLLFLYYVYVTVPSRYLFFTTSTLKGVFRIFVLGFFFAAASLSEIPKPRAFMPI